ncbi:MAG: hypothetical protein OER88_07745, partial [Planctomycetota bacterium]|nr:hypothetical protein [Planctomycetota bacterium]
MARRAVAFAVLLALALLAWWWIDGSRTRAERRDAPGGHGRERVAQRRDDVGAPSLTDTEPARAATYGVTVRDQVGRSLPGLHVGAFRGRSDVAAASTNDKGVAILAGVTGAPVRLYVQPDLGGSIDVAVVDPADGDRDFTATVGLTEMVLRVTLDGEARAPKTWTFRPRLRHVSVDADGTIRGTWAMDGTPTISFLASFQSPGYFTKPLHIGLPNDTRLDVPLRSQHALTIDARAPHDVQRRNGGWHAIKKWDLVPPGTYRVRDRATGAVSDPATIRPQDGGATLRLRIAQLASVEGIVVVPPACDLSQCRVHIQGEGIDQSGLPGAPVDGKTGAFRAEIPGDRKVRLVPHHRFLVPDTTVKTATKERGVVLRMRAAPLVRFRLPEGWPLPRFNDKLEEIPVYLTRNGN